VSGFFGIFRLDGKPIEDRFLQTIADALRFRGPDGQSVWKQNNVGGCFAWMQTGPAKQATQQPVIWRNRYWLWGDLRVDGRKELLQQLSQNDTPVENDATSEELLLRAWEKWSATCLERVIGEFSFALWDAREETLWCARDFIGIRPFYYSQTKELFCFTNNFQTLQLVPEISNDLDEAFLGDFLIEGWSADPSRTVFREIKRLRGGHLLKLHKKEPEIRRFRRLPIEEPLRYKHPEDYLEAYRDLLKSAVTDRLPEGPTALYLSGGLDSGSVCATASQIAESRAKKEKLKAFTLSWKPFFEDPEPHFAQLTAQHLGMKHEILSEQELKLFEAAENPQERPPEPNQEVFYAREQRNSQKIAAHANVILSGDGGDDVLTGKAWPYLKHLSRNSQWKELAQEFGGYFWTHKRMPPLGGGFRTRISKMVKSEDPYDGYPEWLNPDFEQRINLKQRWLELHSVVENSQHPVHPSAYESLHSGYWGSVLETEDAGWTRVRLETRAPLLDLRILAFLLRLPAVPWCVNKELCRQAMKGVLPDGVRERPKTPLVFDPLDAATQTNSWQSGIPKVASGPIERFVNWPKWCETLHHSKGSLNWMILRPLSVFHWLKAVENEKGIK
jgi:asparagine synthase (glutamine-hydrolysing)